MRQRRRLSDYVGDNALDIVACADRDGRFGDDDGEAPEVFSDFARRGVDVTQVRMAIAAPGRRADGDAHRVGLRHRVLEIKAEIEPPGGNIIGD
jgi:hypothetical protein